ncbi:MAG TPA: bifunctional histidinol-phosphatase/imidazoleglycerol-phosphate dehydratase, partial [Candidatus Marinimicrobia bacterium]|nr:bifunctional histidinol-phosphatase/imidazoleglycerol-phosphate dehydratase [Candidatus Neomarinimicrobiota bacterium]
HFFYSFAQSAGANLSIRFSGKNEHHQIEAVFKAVARSIRQAIGRDPHYSKMSSTKGSL